MSTLEVIKFQDIIPVREITRIVPNVFPTTIEIEGDDFSSVEEVFINETKVPEFVIVSKKKMFVTLPETVRQVRTISVRSAEFTRTAEGSKVSYQIGNRSRQVNGVLRLVQLFIRYLLTSPGSDIFSPTEGGGLQEAVGVLGTTNKTAPILSVVNACVQRTQDQVTRMQLNQNGLTLDERLLSVEVLDLSVNQNLDEVTARLKIVPYSGDEALVNIQL